MKLKKKGNLYYLKFKTSFIKTQFTNDENDDDDDDYKKLNNTGFHARELNIYGS